MANILIIDENKLFCDMLHNVARVMEHDVTSTDNLANGLRATRSGEFDIVFLAARMTSGSSLRALPKILASCSFPEVIVISDTGIPDEAEAAIKMGAWDYIVRPSQEAMALPLVRALQYRAKKAPVIPTSTLKQETFREIVGESPQIKSCMETVARAADSDASILITGETGTGKELFAWAIHNNSARAEKPFVVVDCGALPETLVESTLFGHEKGAFTGAERGQDGLISQADGGTLFLDEVGELPHSVQKAFLRVIEERRYRPVGNKRELTSDFRLIAASNRNFEEMIKKKLFRKDLFFRLRSFSIVLPPLRERIQDLEELVKHYTKELCRDCGTRNKTFSPEFLGVLAKHNWPGNVRELSKTLESAIVAARDEPMLYPMHLPNEMRAKVVRKSVDNENVCQKKDELQRSYSKSQYPNLQAVRDAALAEIEENYLRRLISETNGDVKKACCLSGLRSSRLYELLKKYDITRKF